MDRDIILGQRRFWTKREIKFLKRNYARLKAKEIGKKLKRTKSSIQTKAFILKLDGNSKDKFWGKNNPFWHKKHSEKTKQIISLKAKERFKDPRNNPMWHKTHSKEAVKKIIKANKGRKMSMSSKRKIGLASKKRWQNKSFNISKRNKKISLKQKKNWKNPKYRNKVTKRVLQGLKIKPNRPERIMIQIIIRNKFPFVYTGNGKVIINGFNPDFLFQNLIIEVFGEYHHNLPEVKKRDKRKLRAYSSLGYKTLIIWSNELKEPQKVVEKIRGFLKC
jgi:hypothetical protein